MRSVLALLCLLVALAPPAHAAPSVILAPDATGDFGPQTPGTKTAGWQEALDYCVAHHRDLYVKGGYGGANAIYNVQDTIRFPPAQDFRVDGGVYVVNWVGGQDRDLMVIDSTMNCDYRLGILVYGGAQAALRVRPERPVPIDGFAVCVETRIESQGMADPHPFTPGERKAGTGVVLDGSKASIVHSDFRFESVINFRTCIAVTQRFAYNRLFCPHLHTNADHSTLLIADEGVRANTMSITVGVDQGAVDVTGLVLAGSRNEIDLAQRESDKPFARGCSLILKESAEGNQINLRNPSLADPAEMVTDHATIPTNQVTWAGPPAPISTVAVKASAFEYVQHLYPATMRIDGGRAVRVTLVRGTQQLACAPGRDIALSVGDRLVVRSARPPRLTVVPLKVR
jgi:hypothetical protein